MSVTEREDIPVNLNKEFYDEGLLLRNKLLMWRFRNYFKIDMNKKYDLGKLEPRVKQIVSSYVALFSNNEKSFEEFKIYIKDYQEDLIDERQQSFEGSIIGAIHSLLNNQQINFTAKDIIDKGEFTGRTGKPMNPRALNSYLKSLGFAKSEQIRVDGRIKRVVPIDKKILNNLFERYGFDSTDVPIVPVVTVISHFNNNKEKGVKST